MCEPVTLMVIAGATMAAGAGVQMYGQYQEGKAAEASGKYNARMDEIKAESVAEQASFDARQRSKQNMQDVSLGLVSAAGSGLTLNSGSVTDWEGDMQSAMESDFAVIEHNSELQRFGFFGSANLSRAEGKFARKASYWKMGATALSTAGSLGMGYASFSQAGKAPGGGAGQSNMGKTVSAKQGYTIVG